MARTKPQGALKDIQRSVERVQTAGEQLARRIRRDARSLLTQGRAELVKDVRSLRRQVQTRAEHAIRDLEKKVAKRFHAATIEGMGALERRVVKLEGTLAELERKLATAGRTAA